MNVPPIDNGARFHKCDLQIHTLRDENWKGHYDLLDDRDTFARDLVADCRRKGIQAIAITDHHDLCLWKHIADAASKEQTPEGNPIPKGQILTVFPGVELSLSSPPCQALLIFDQNLTPEELSPVLSTLQIVPNPECEKHTTPTTPLSGDLTLDEITKRLSSIRTNPSETNPTKYEFLKNRFILLPNLKESGYKSIYRKDFHTLCSQMPCVGGYIEKSHYSELSQGNLQKIEGKVEEWGKRPLAVFQTSDNRRAELSDQIPVFPDLGKWPTWIKWAQPSAEALRQACLGKNSRITQSEPAFPLLQIVGVAVSNSKFLGAITLGINPQFNAFIGGRGTGKSSLLEYIRWALCDDPLSSENSSELPDFQKRRRSLVNETLKPLGSSVSVFYKKNEVIYRIERRIDNKSDLVNVVGPDGTAEQLTPEQIRRDFPIVSYAQKQLSCVGTLPEEINRLITDPIKTQLLRYQDSIENDILPKIRTQRERERRLTTLLEQIAVLTKDARTKKEQIVALQSQLQNLTPEQQNTIAKHEHQREQYQTLTNALSIPKRVAEILNTAIQQVKAIGTIPKPSASFGFEGLGEIIERANNSLQEASETLNSLIQERSEWFSAEQNQAIQALEFKFSNHQQSYQECITANSKNAAQLEEIKILNTEITEIEKHLSEKNIEYNTESVAFREIGDDPKEAFLHAVRTRGKLMAEQCEKISEQAQHDFKAQLAPCGNTSSVVDAISKIIAGSNVKDSNYKTEKLAHLICSSPEPILQWASVISELETLLDSKGKDDFPECPIFESCDFTIANLQSMRSRISFDLIEQIRYFNIDDQITFLFRMGKKRHETNYIPFTSASPGQQATCLLRTLLAQEGAPLLIDQPEEDLDNEQIQILSERIAATKHNRQLIFVSHNANIVVNGDAELVACFGYKEDENNTIGGVLQEGSIDCQSVRTAITKVMEGGKAAFQMRREKYGF